MSRANLDLLTLISSEHYFADAINEIWIHECTRNEPPQVHEKTSDGRREFTLGEKGDSYSIQILKEMSFENNPLNYTYSNEKKITTL